VGFRYQITTDDEGRGDVSVFLPDGKILVADQDHPNWREILKFLTAPPATREVLPTDPPRDQQLERLLAEEEEIEREAQVRNLFDVTLAIGTKFESLSERVKVLAGRVFFDGEEVHSVLTDQIVRFLREGADFQPLVKFYEKIATNPTKHSQDNLYRWLVAQGNFTINDDGNIVAYKGLTSDGYSIHGGPDVIVDGVTAPSGRIKNAVGSVIEMPRSKVNHDPSQGCSVGLHAGTYDFAKGFGGSGLLAEVEINPRDVVSVPTDSGDAKMRVCRYKVLKYVTYEVPTALYGHEYDDDLDEFDNELEDFEGDLDEYGTDDEEVAVPVGALRSVLGALRKAVTR
jgi:hypothetical protein